MDDILLALHEQHDLHVVFLAAQANLSEYGLITAEDKIQFEDPLFYLGQKLVQNSIMPQNVQIHRDTLHTLNDFQKSLGDIKRLPPTLGRPTYQPAHLFDVLKWDSNLNSPRKLIPEASQELQWIEQKVASSQLTQINPSLPVSLLILPSPHSPTGVLWQANGITEWIFLSTKVFKKLSTYLDKIGMLIFKG